MGRRPTLKRNYDDEGNLISKECNICHEVKLVSEFSKCKSKSDGYQLKCKECIKKYNQEYRQENPNYDKKHYQENKCEIKKRKKRILSRK